MSYYLSEEELEDVAERSCLRDMERAIATAASDKAYAAGREESRAEVEVMRRAVGVMAQCMDCDDCPILFECSEGLGRCPESQLVEWAISEARKGE